jgi:hypothetical protein
MTELTTTTALLVDLYRRGVSLRPVGDRLEVTAPQGTLTRELRVALTAHKPRLLELLPLVEEYRALLRGAFALLAPDSPALTDDLRDYGEEQARLVDELGPVLAGQVCLMAGRQWRMETSVCPWCDAAGECHEPIPGT